MHSPPPQSTLSSLTMMIQVVTRIMVMVMVTIIKRLWSVRYHFEQSNADDNQSHNQKFNHSHSFYTLKLQSDQEELSIFQEELSIFGTFPSCSKILFQLLFFIWRVWDLIHVCHHVSTLGHFLCRTLLVTTLNKIRKLFMFENFWVVFLLKK